MSADSIAVHSKNEKNTPIWADVPMRAFAGGFYHNLVQMYKYLGINYHAQPFLFSFTKLPPRPTKSSVPSPHMIYTSNFHQIPPIPCTHDLLLWLLEAAYALICYIWFTVCCFFVAPLAEDPRSAAPGESLDQYLRRIRLPHAYVANYLLPLISSVCTCSHQEMLQFPASDVLDYKRRTHRQQHYVVTAGVQSVQEKLLNGLDARLGVELNRVTPQSDGVQIEYLAADGRTTSERFDLVVLAVSPDAAARLFAPVRFLETIPTTPVKTVAHTDESHIAPMLHAIASSGGKNNSPNRRDSETQRIHFLSTDTTTEAVHEQPNSMLVTTNPLLPVEESKIIRSAGFIRVLRDPQSRLLVNSLFSDRNRSDEKHSSAFSSWRSGDNGVYLAGGWCWDGMVLLEGCIVSAMRIASDLGVDIPWETPVES